jgi:hypothetical protein
MENGRWKADSIPQYAFSIFLLIVLIWLSRSLAFADVTASLHVSTSPGGDAVEAVRSGTARVYAVLSYQDTAQTELKVLVFAGTGAVLFEHSAIYDGSGQTDIEITGRDIFAGYVSAAQTKSAELQEAEDIAYQASSASAKRVRTASVVNVVTALDGVLAALERYPLSLERVDRLEEARDLATEVTTQGTRIMNEVSDDDLDSAMDQLKALVSDTIDAVNSALGGIDTSAERAWLDGTYTIQLKRNGQISVGFDWEVSPDGVPGTPVAPSPTAGAGPTETPTLTATQEPRPTLTPTERLATASPRPTATSAARATPPPQPSYVQPTTAPTATGVPAVQNTVQPGPIILPPTPVPVQALTPATPRPPVQVIPINPPATEGQTGYPAPPAADVASPAATPGGQAMSQDTFPPESRPAAGTSGSRVPEASHEIPLAPQAVLRFPVGRIAALVSAVVFGLVALWLRTKI